jgi:type III pantothenate kinase
MSEEAVVLVIDVGNSRLKWGWRRDGILTPGEPCISNYELLPGELDHRWGDAPAPARAIIANVAGFAVAAVLHGWMKERWNLHPRFIRAETCAHGVANGYAHPEKLGVDRWAALVGARRLQPGAVCVADCGTAITVDLLDAAGQHLGGLIAPGLNLMRRALIMGAHGLSGAERGTGEFLACDTAAAMSGGARLAAAGLIERVLRDSARRLGETPALLLTGGDAEAIGAELDAPYRSIPELVLEGLLVIDGE